MQIWSQGHSFRAANERQHRHRADRGRQGQPCGQSALTQAFLMKPTFLFPGRIGHSGRHHSLLLHLSVLFVLLLYVQKCHSDAPFAPTARREMIAQYKLSDLAARDFDLSLRLQNVGGGHLGSGQLAWMAAKGVHLTVSRSF